MRKLAKFVPRGKLSHLLDSARSLAALICAAARSFRAVPIIIALVLNSPGQLYALRPMAASQSLKQPPFTDIKDLTKLDLEIRATRALAVLYENIVPAITPFRIHAHEIEPDKAGIRRHIEHLLSLGVKSVLIMGATGEFKNLSNTKRLKAIRIFAEESKGRLTLFANATGDNEEETLQNIVELHRMPYINAVVDAPLCYLRDSSEIASHIKKIKPFLLKREIKSHLPLVLYNNPGIHKVNGSIVEPEVIAELKAIEELRDYLFAIKDSSGNMELLEKYIKLINTFVGDERLIEEGVIRGAVGSVSSMGNALRLPQEIFKPNADAAEIKRLQARINELENALTGDLKKQPAALKYYLSLLGVCDYIITDPAKALDAAQEKVVEEVWSAFHAPASEADQPSPEGKEPAAIERARAIKDTFSEEINKMITELESLVTRQDSILNRILSQTDIYAGRTGPEAPEEPIRSNALALLQDNFKSLKKLCAETMVVENDIAVDILSKSMADLLNDIKNRFKEQQAVEQFSELCQKASEVIFAMTAFRNLSAVLRNSRHFKGECFEDDLVRFIENSEVDFSERSKVASGVFFAENTLGGILALFSDKAMAGIDAEERERITEDLLSMVRDSVDDCLSFRGERAMAKVRFNLYHSFLHYDTEPELNTLMKIMEIFMEKNILTFNLDSIRSALSNKVIYASAKTKDFDFLRKAGFALTLIDTVKAIQVVMKETVPHWVYHCFLALQYHVEAGGYPPKTAEKILATLMFKVGDSQWPKIQTEAQLKAHIDDPVQRELSSFLKEVIPRTLLKDEHIKIFKEYYQLGPDEDDLALVKLQQAIARTHEAMCNIPRHLFLPAFVKWWVSLNGALAIPLGHGQTISQPLFVQMMTALLDPKPDDVVLEIGTGGGYQAAILSKLTRKVYTIERFKDLSEMAEATCDNLGADNIEFYVGDGSNGLPEKGSFDIIMVTAGSPTVPEPLLKQLKEGGRLLIAAKSEKTIKKPWHIYETLLIVKRPGAYLQFSLGLSGWVPLVGEQGHKDREVDKESILEAPKRLSEFLVPDAESIIDPSPDISSLVNAAA